MKVALPIGKIDRIWHLLEKHAIRLVSARHLYDLVPFVQQHEKDLAKKELPGRELGIIFDGSTRLGEAVAVIAWHALLDAEAGQYMIQQRLVQLEILAYTHVTRMYGTAIWQDGDHSQSAQVLSSQLLLRFEI